MLKRIAVMSFSGKIGKTTIAAHLLAARMPDAVIYAMETNNETAASLGLEVEKMSGDKFAGVFKKLLVEDSAIIDVGASNIEKFLDKMVKIDESHIEFDAFLIPVTQDVSIQRECIKTVRTLNAIGIPREKVLIVFNRVQASVKDEFSAILSFAEKEKMCIANPNAAIFDSEVFPMLAGKKLSMGNVLFDSTDYRAKLKEKDISEKDKQSYSDMHLLKQYVKSANRNMDEVFAALFPG